MSLNLIKVQTKPCMHCGKTSEVEMTGEQHHRYYEQREFVQVVFPDWTADQRELLISGTHPACWDVMFPEEEDD